MSHDILAGLSEKARLLSRSVAFPDALDVRTLRAAAALASSRVLRPVLVGSSEVIRSLASSQGVGLDGVTIEDPSLSAHLGRVELELAAIEKGNAGRGGSGPRHAGDPLIFAGMMVRSGLVHGSVAGSVSTTADVIRAALRTIGLRPGVKKVSSYFLMIFPGRVMAFADCAVLPEPTAGELAEIAGLAADNFRIITGLGPVVAFLSFSTKGSAGHPAIEKARSAAAMFRASRPDIEADGELQVDAAIDPGVARMKAPGSPVAGNANVLIFPDLNSGNIGYKIAQRLGGAVALGPILQGLAKPAFDLSRGCSVEDIVHVATINVLTPV